MKRPYVRLQDIKKRGPLSICSLYLAPRHLYDGMFPEGGGGGGVGGGEWFVSSVIVTAAAGDMYIVTVPIHPFQYF